MLLSVIQLNCRFVSRIIQKLFTVYMRNHDDSVGLIHISQMNNFERFTGYNLVVINCILCNYKIEQVMEIYSI